MKSIGHQPIKKVEYESIRKVEFENEDDWNELQRYTDILIAFCEEKGRKLEDKDLVKTENEINLKSFIGNYKFRSGKLMQIRHDPRKLSDDEFLSLTRDVAEWACMLGPPFLKTVLSALSPVTEEDEILLAYSDLLRDYTESALLEYIPPLVERRRRKAPIPMGKILVPQTLSYYLQGQWLFISQRTKMNIETLPLLLMIRFNAEIAQKLVSKILKKFENMEKESWGSGKERKEEAQQVFPVRVAYKNRDYHTNFILGDSYRKDLLERAWETDFMDIEILEKLREQTHAVPALGNMTLLWEAYTGRRVLMGSKIFDILSGGYNLKPLSKLYELWCLMKVLETLEKGLKFESVDKEFDPDFLSGKFRFKNGTHRVTVLYNKDRRKFVGIFEELKRAGLKIGEIRPDIIIEVVATHPPEKRMIVIDAKYRKKTNIDLGDVKELFSYMVECSATSQIEELEGIFFYPGEETESISCKKPDVTIHLLGLKPSYLDDSIKKFKRVLKL